MKIKILFIVFICFESYSFSQNLNLTELCGVCNKSNWDQVNEFMLNKSWEYYSSAKESESQYGTITWTYNKERYSDKALGWCYLYTYNNIPSKIEYSFSNKSSYNTIKSGITNLGLRVIDNSIEDGKIVTKYGGGDYIVTITAEQREKEDDFGANSITAYSIVVIKKGSVFDTGNGLKKRYDDNGNLESEYFLKDDELNGIAKVYYKNGNIKVESNYLKGKRNGKSKEYDENGNLTGEYNYINDLPNGIYRIYEDGKLRVLGNLVNGIKDGLFRIYDPDGNLDKEYTMKDDMLNGTYTEYFYDENRLVIKNSGQYLNSIKNGLWEAIKYRDKGSELLYSCRFINGEPTGSSKEVRNDSIIFCNYKNGKLNGSYKIFSSLITMLTGELTGDTATSVLTTSGYYANGKKSGNWKYYSLTKVLRKEGNYRDNNKIGQWKYYYDKILIDGSKNQYEPYSCKLYLIENYENDELNGQSIQYSSLRRTPILCDTSKIKDVAPSDTCYKMEYDKSSQTANFQNGKLNGLFEHKDSLGLLRFKGNFINDQKDGFWIESYTSDGFLNLDGFYMYKKGNYELGNRVGKWTMQWGGYSDNDRIETEYNYKDGKLNGNTIEFNKKGKPATIYKLEMGNLKSVDVYDSLGISIIRQYIITNETDTFYKCLAMNKDQDGRKIYQEYLVKKKSPDPLSPEFFELFFKLNTGKNSDNGYADGQYKVFDSSDQILIDGFYFKEDKKNTWKLYYYDSNVLKEQNFELGYEKYYEIKSGKLFSGNFIQKFDNMKPKYEFKISKGLRNGKSIYYGEDGKVLKIENYKNGVLY